MMDIDKNTGVSQNEYGSIQQKDFKVADGGDSHIMSKINLGLEVPQH